MSRAPNTESPVSPPAPAPEGLKVLRVDPGTVGARVGIKPGDRLMALNGHALGDVIDLWFHSAAQRLKLAWNDTEGVPRERTVRKAFHERLGIEVEPFEIRRCTNYCVFCFVHQLPSGMRRELYIKDEDYRLSFLYGNYITGTNLSPDDIARILRMKLSPLYFSIHATDQAVRERLLAKQGIEPVIPLLKRLTTKGIFVHAQIVLCPGINDGSVLEQTVNDLAGLYPRVESVAVVPLGMTNHRQRLPNLQPVTPEYARDFIPRITALQARVKRRVGFPVVFPSDEFFLIAGLEPPGYGQYPEIPQLANGVGMFHRLYDGIEEVVGRLPERLPASRRIAAITTPMGRRVIQRLVDLVNRRVTNARVEILETTNTLFGEGITVTGLLPGADFLRTIRANPGFDRYLIPENSLRPWDRRFLDDMMFDDLRAEAGAEVEAGGETAPAFLSAAFNLPTP